jgi:hypothetical protein
LVYGREKQATLPGAMSASDSPLAGFPGVRTERDYVVHTLARLSPMGFTADNTIACVGTCRDEICSSLGREVTEVWGEAFNFSSLGGMLLLGKTGVGAACHHAPIENGRARYVFFAMPHIGVLGDGRFGLCKRPGRSDESAACGTLAAIVRELELGPLETEVDPNDIEISIVRQALSPRIEGRSTSMLDLTLLLQQIIEHDLERLLELSLGRCAADYGVFTGIQIHTPAGNQVWPKTQYAVVNGQRRRLNL